MSQEDQQNSTSATTTSSLLPPPPPPPLSSTSTSFSSPTKKEDLKVTIVDDNDEAEGAKSEAEVLTTEQKLELAKLAEKMHDDAKELMAQGRYKEASDVLSHVLEKKSLIYGEGGVECLETYIDYGKSLLTMAKQINAMKSVFASDPKKAILDETNKKDKKKETEKGDDDDDDDDEKEEEEEEEEEDKKGDGDDEDGEEDVNELLETAWDCLELARVISSKTNPNTLKLSDVLIDIGDISLENGNSQLALDDYDKALKLRLGLCKPDDRRIAEVYYSIGLAYSTMPENEEKSKENYVKSKESMVKRIDTLSKDPNPKNEEEIKELRELISDVDARIEELSTNIQEGYLTMEKIKEFLKENMGGLVSSLAGGENKLNLSSAPVTNLGVVGHTEKRKAEEDSKETEQPPAKKTC